MNTERTVIIENISDIPVSLLDTQNRRYLLKSGGKMRISAVTLQDILDMIGNRPMFNRGRVCIKNITREELYNMGLTEEEIDKYLVESEPFNKPIIKKNEEIVEEEKEEDNSVKTKKASNKKSTSTTKKAVSKSQKL